MSPSVPVRIQPVRGNLFEQNLEDNVEPIKDLHWSVEPSSLLIHTVYNAKTVSASYMSGISTLTLSWNLICENVNIAVYTVGCQISFLVFSRSDAWTDLISSFKRLDENLPSSEIYPTCRSLAIKIFFYVFFLILSLETLLVLLVTSNDITWLRKILDVSGLLTKIYPATQLALFCILTQIISLQLGAIRKCIDDQLNQLNPASPVLVEIQYRQLNILRRHHRLVCNSVRKINCCFGTFLTFEIIYIFVSFINCSLFILMSAISDDVPLGVMNTMSDKVFEALAEMHHQEPPLQYEVMLFIEQLSHMKSNINAMGFFDVKKQLFPSLIGTTLTYFLILLQFQSAEKTGNK
ncbi:hypothetical protein OUZ56_014563 [Daphnia magna]|uniref:Gustatory receptor n=1 Tax=Daphnia magna TaxID=35525 RepID=A0ABR0AK46_9CRUS|nr:hypothetical protein OUZ56_014563 [Daphnia magna]